MGKSARTQARGSATSPPESATDDPVSRVRTGAAAAAATAASLVALLLHVRHYLPFLADDALISLRYSRRLLQGHGLTWTEGPRVEGYSNLLWVLCTSALGALGIELVAAARAFGVGCMAAAVLAVGFWAWRRSGPWAEAFAAGLAGGLALALAGPIAVWAAAGLEGPLVAALLAWALVLAHPLFGANPDRRAYVASVPLALLVLTRPDGPLFTGAFALALLLARGVNAGTLALAARLAALPVLAAVGQQVFRLAYYHSWVPNPARLKVAFTMHRLNTGLDYAGQAFASMWPLLAIAALGAVLGFRRRELRGFTGLLVLAFVLWTAYVIVIGGDFFPGYRHLIPPVVCAAFLCAIAARELVRAPRAARFAIVALPALLAGFGSLQRSDPENARARLETWVWAGEATGKLLGRAFGEQRALLAVVSAGCFPYWSELPCIDMLGLNDEYIAKHPPPDVGHGWAGHEFGDAGYVLGREPDIIQFSGIANTGRTGFFRVEQELAKSPLFQSRYVLVNFESTDPIPVVQALYVRRDSPRIGITSDSAAVRVPAMLFASYWRSRAGLDSTGRISVMVAREKPAVYSGLELPAGRWRVDTVPPTSRLIVGYRPAAPEGDFTLVPRLAPIPFEQGRPLDLVVTADAENDSLRVREVVLTRETAPAR